MLTEDRLGGVREALERAAAESARRNDLLAAYLTVLTAALVVVALFLF
jgi:hypothetical protein